MELGAGWVKAAVAGRQTMGRPNFNDTAQTEVRVNEDPPDQIHAVERGEGRVAEGSGFGGVKVCRERALNGDTCYVTP